MLIGEGATAFAKMIGMEEEDLGTDASRRAHESWSSSACQPNYYRKFDGAEDSCPPYLPPQSAADGAASIDTTNTNEILVRDDLKTHRQQQRSDPARLQISEYNHDTIGMVVVDEGGDLSCGTTTNGAANKVAGRVGDSPVAGAGCYVDNDIGGAAATGDGDVMMRCAASKSPLPVMLL